MTEQKKAANSKAMRTVFLDRDGVINEKAPEGEYVRRVEDLKLLPDAAAAIARLNCTGVRVVAVTNQRGVALGLYSKEDVLQIEAALDTMLAAEGANLDGFYFCPHDAGACNCRKPQPGLFEQAKQDFPEILAAESIMIGDSLSDIEFGRNLGMRTIFIEGPAERQRSGAEQARDLADMRAQSLAEAVQFLLQSTSQIEL